MDQKISDALRAPFPNELIGKRPQPTCRQCSQAQGKVCERHQKVNCVGCGQWITSAHIHLDFVGHADITDRFLAVDPEWFWEPLAFNDQGLPAFDQNGGMWIRLTIAGVTRLGYGDAAGKTGPNAVKEAIGDALRNAGMRFGVGLDMRRKETTDSEADAPRAAPAKSQQAPSAPATQTDIDWAEKFEERLNRSTNSQALKERWEELQAAHNSGRVTEADAIMFKEAIGERKNELAQMRGAA
jgi:hypothetical protein